MPVSTGAGRRRASTAWPGRLGWSGAALLVAVLLVLAASLSMVYMITRPMRRITATVRRLTAGDYTVRAPVTGSAEVRQVAESINTQADESDRLRAAEAESNRLRAMAREAGLRIREHLVARDVLNAAKLAVEQIVDADVAYLRLLEDDQIGSVVGQAPRWLIPADVIKAHLPPGAIDHLRALFRAQTSQVINDLVGGDTGQMPPQLRQTLREAGVSGAAHDAVRGGRRTARHHRAAAHAGRAPVDPGRGGRHGVGRRGPRPRAQPRPAL